MIDKKISAQIVDRMSGLDFFPTSKQAIAEMQRAFAEAFDCSADALMFATDWMKEHAQAPKPVEIWNYSRSLKETRGPNRPICRNCWGQRWIAVDNPNGSFAGYALRCPECSSHLVEA